MAEKKDKPEEAAKKTNTALDAVLSQIRKEFGELSTPPLDAAEIKELVNIAHGEGFAVMAHASGTERVRMAALAGADTIEHGYYMDEESIKIYTKNSKIMFKSDNVTMLSNLMNGQYPQYNQLIPQSFPKEAKVNVSKLVSSLELVSTMVNEKTNSVKFNFCNDTLYLMADTPEEGNSQSEIDIKYSGEDIVIAFNYRYLLEFLKNTDAEDVIICMNTNLSSTVIKPDNEEDFIYLVMPVQIR